jgi:hypothetical protein
VNLFYERDADHTNFLDRNLVVGFRVITEVFNNKLAPL